MIHIKIKLDDLSKLVKGGTKATCHKKANNVIFVGKSTKKALIKLISLLVHSIDWLLKH